MPASLVGWVATRQKADGIVLSDLGVEVPRTDKASILVLRDQGKGFDLIDDFVGPMDDSMEKRIIADGKLIYADFEGRTVLTRELCEKSG